MQRRASAARNQEDPSDAPCPGIDGRVRPDHDRIVSGAMMERVAFRRLNAGLAGTESPKQAKSGLARLPRVLDIDGNGIRESIQIDTRRGFVGWNFHRIWLIC
jgi:hypothetical protein